MTGRARWLLIAVALGFLIAVLARLPGLLNDADAVAERPPNILMIVLDDFGYNDLGANGNPDTPTPNLDDLAAQGIRFTRHYTDASCSATRAALVTGTFPAIHGLRPNHLGLSPGTPTIASMLAQAGYTTEHIGKWHIASATEEQSPLRYGFDNWFGVLHNNELGGPSLDGIHYRIPTYFNPWLRDNESPLVQHVGHLTDILTERTIRFLEQQQDSAQPWFLNLWYFAPHKPIQPGDAFRRKYPDTEAGAYHALVDQLDTNIGRILVALDTLQLADDTLVIVLSDNGGTNEAMDNNAPFHGTKAYFSEGALRTPLLLRWPGRIGKGLVSDDLASMFDIFPTIAAASGSTAPTHLIGRNLLDPELANNQPLYWEYSTSRNHLLSVLSADGRWRYARLFGTEALLDLHGDPTGGTNVIDQHPEIAAQLYRNYLLWRMQARIVDFSHEPLNDRGAAILRGNDLQRSPGYSGFTFAIGVTAEPGAGSGRQVIVDHPERWRVSTTEGGGLLVEILGQSLETPELPAGECVELVVSAHFNFSPVHPNSNRSTIDVYLNGERVGKLIKEMPELKLAGYAHPTHLGANAQGREPFKGVLGHPVILNERVVPDSEGTEIGNGVSGVPPTCAPESGSAQ